MCSSDLEGLRRSAEGPIARSAIYAPPRFADLSAEVAAWPGSLQELISEHHGVDVARIEQVIAGEVLDAEAAKTLSVKRGEAGLRTLRRYLDAEGALMLASDSLHPASRFAYTMTYVRGRA